MVFDGNLVAFKVSTSPHQLNIEIANYAEPASLSSCFPSEPLFVLTVIAPPSSDGSTGTTSVRETHRGASALSGTVNASADIEHVPLDPGDIGDINEDIIIVEAVDDESDAAVAEFALSPTIDDAASILLAALDNAFQQFSSITDVRRLRRALLY